MAEKEKVTFMVLKIRDLQCCKCYKKVKKVLCKFPQIRDQIYDEKQNQVLIKVVCCSPEKIRDKIFCKLGCAIERIDIKNPEKSPPEKSPPEKSPTKPPPVELPTEKTNQPPEKPNPPPEKRNPPPENPNPPEKLNPLAPCPVFPCPVVPWPVVHRYPQAPTCCTDCYHGRSGGPCQRGYGGPAPYIQYDGYCGRPVYDSYGGGWSYNNNYCVTRSDCFSEGNPQGCIVM